MKWVMHCAGDVDHHFSHRQVGNNMHRTHYLLISLLLLNACGGVVGKSLPEPDYSISSESHQELRYLGLFQTQFGFTKDVRDKDGKKCKNFFLKLAYYNLDKNIEKPGKNTFDKDCRKIKDHFAKTQLKKIIIWAKRPSKFKNLLTQCKIPEEVIEVKDKDCFNDDKCKNNEISPRIDIFLKSNDDSKNQNNSVETPPNKKKDIPLDPEVKNQRGGKIKGRQQKSKPPEQPKESTQTTQKKKPKQPKYKKKTIPYNWMLVYDISTESKLSTKNTLGDLLMKDKKLNVKLGALVFSAGIDMYKTKKSTAMELHARQPAIQHANITSSTLALKKKKRLIDRRKINSLIYIGPDALSMSEEQLKEMKPVKNPKKLVYLIVDEDGCKKSKINSLLQGSSKQIRKQFETNKTLVSCIKEKDLELVLKSLPNSKTIKVKIEQ